MQICESRRYLLDIFPGDKIFLRYENLLTQIQDILEKMGIIDDVYINTDLLELSVLDYFEDIARLKEFQGIPRVNVDKIYSYGIYWFLRRNPIQILNPALAPEYIHINEKTAVAITISKMLREAGISADDISRRVYELLDLLYYNLKYRTFTQQSLELMIEAFFCGCRCLSQKEAEADG